MSKIDMVTNTLISLVLISCVMRVAYCFFISMDSNKKEQYIERAKNSIVFTGLAVCIWSIKSVIMSYYI